MVDLHCTLHTDKNQKKSRGTAVFYFPWHAMKMIWPVQAFPSIGTMNLNTS